MSRPLNCELLCGHSCGLTQRVSGRGRDGWYAYAKLHQNCDVVDIGIILCLEKYLLSFYGKCVQWEVNNLVESALVECR